MIPLSHTLVALKPARQAALQAIMTVEESRSRGARLPALPHARTFLRVLTGSSRINTAVAQRIPGLNWEPKNRLCSLKQVEEALDRLIATKGGALPAAALRGCAGRTVPGGDAHPDRSPDAARENRLYPQNAPGRPGA